MEVTKMYYVKTVTAEFLTTSVDEFLRSCEGGATVTAVREVNLAHLEQWGWVELHNKFQKKSLTHGSK